MTLDTKNWPQYYKSNHLLQTSESEILTSIRVLSYLRYKTLGWTHELVLKLTWCPYSIVQIKAKHSPLQICRSFLLSSQKQSRQTSDSSLSGSNTSLQFIVHPSGFEEPNIFKPDLANARQQHEEAHRNHNLKHQI